MKDAEKRPAQHDNAGDSWYQVSRNWNRQFDFINEDVRADVCVLGGGLTGLSAAVELAEAGYEVVLLEAHQLAWGASGRSGGQLIVGYGCEPEVIEQQLGFAATKSLIEISAQAVDKVRQRISRHNIDCGLRTGQTHCALKSRHVAELHRWQERMAGYGYPHLQWLDRESLKAHIDTQAYLGGMYDANAGHLHPLNYTLGLARAAEAASVRIYENSAVERISRGGEIVLHCAHASVRCRFAVIAGNAHLDGLLPQIENRRMPAATYITATEPLGQHRARQLLPQDGAFTDVNFVLDYFRLSQDTRLLFGGLVSYSLKEPGNLAASMRTRMLRVFPQLRDVAQEYTWGGYVAITMNRAPHFGRIDDNIYFAHGYSGHGMAMTTMAGHLIALAIRGQSERFDAFARIRHRRFPGGKLSRTPLLVLAMAYYRLLDLI